MCSPKRRARKSEARQIALEQLKAVADGRQPRPGEVALVKDRLRNNCPGEVCPRERAVEQPRAGERCPLEVCAFERACNEAGVGKVGISERRRLEPDFRTVCLRQPAAGKRHVRAAARNQADRIHPAAFQAAVGHLAGREGGVREIAVVEVNALQAALERDAVRHRCPTGPR